MSNQGHRGRRKVLRGVVVSDKMNKTRVVAIYRMKMHPKYRKYIKVRKKIYVHDENNESRVGDLVEVMETRPLSRLKRWRLVKILRKAPVLEEIAKEVLQNEESA